MKKIATAFPNHQAKKRRGGLVVAVVTVFVLVGIIFGIRFNPLYDLPQAAKTLIQTAVENQYQIEQSIQEDGKVNQYPLESPLVIQNPYGTTPLTALVIFDTPEPARITIHVPGHTPQVAVNYTFSEFQRHHQIPIYGLYPGEMNPVTIQAETNAGQTSQTILKLQTEQLPVGMEQMKVLNVSKDFYQPGFNFSFLDHKQIYDQNGDIRWYSTKISYQVFSLLKNGHYLFTYTIDNHDDLILMEEDLLGKIYAIYDVSTGIHHDISELPDGNFLATSEDPKADTKEDLLLEIDRSSGQVVRTIDIKAVLDPNRPTLAGKTEPDWLHLNSIEYDPADQSIIISSRAQSAVVKLTYPGMQIRWILGAHDNWSEKYQPYLLNPVGEPFEWSWSQHHATLYPSNSPAAGTTDVLLFDNAEYRSFNPADQYSATESYSRVVIYRVDPQEKTVTQLWEYGQERGPELFSVSRGSAYTLANGNILGTWSDINKDKNGVAQFKATENGTVETRLIEVNPTDNRVVFESTIPGATSYRIFRAGLYDGYHQTGDLTSIPIHDTSARGFFDRLNRLSLDEQRWQAKAVLSLKWKVKSFLASIGIRR